MANDVGMPIGTEILTQSALVTDDDWDDLGAGIQASFPVIGYRQGRWRLKWQGSEELLVDERGIPVPEIAVAFVRVPKHKSKRYWPGGYDDKSRLPPACWSNDAIRPDPTLTPPVQPDGRPTPTTCAQCYFDVVGSLVSADGTKRMKACGDYKRTVVKLYYPTAPFEELANQNVAVLLQVPSATLKALKAYGDYLTGKKVHASARITYIGFDDNARFQKFTFREGPALTDDEFLNIRTLRNSDETARILNEEVTISQPDAAEAVYDEGDNGQAQTAPQPQAQAAPPRQAPPAPTQPVRPQGAVPSRPSVVPPQAAPAAQPAARAAPVQPAARPAEGRPVYAPTRPAAPTGITQAVSRPAAPPASARVVQHPSAPQPPVQEVEEAVPDVPDQWNDKFEELMSKS